MDHTKIGQLIYRLPKERHLTQQQLADQIGISDKTVSKWERGLGCPDVSFLLELSGFFNVDLEKLLSGQLDENEISGGNMKRMKFYVCPVCGNLVTAAAEAGISCCGKKLEPMVPRKADEGEQLNVDTIENEYFITSRHPMERSHYLAFVALVTGDSVILRRQYPEWELQTRVPVLPHGTLFWYCTEHGLFYQKL